MNPLHQVFEHITIIFIVPTKVYFQLMDVESPAWFRAGLKALCPNPAQIEDGLIRYLPLIQRDVQHW